MKTWHIKDRLVISLTLLAMTCSWLVIPASSASAATGGYPNSGALPHNIANYEWWVDEDRDGKRDITLSETDNDEAMSARGYYYKNCTDWAAWRVISGLGVSSAKVAGLGHAKTWGDKSAEKGITVNATAAVGSVAVDTSRTYGHVGFVEAINGSKITISEYNKLGTGDYSRVEYDPGEHGFDKYVHFEKLATKTLSGVPTEAEEDVPSIVRDYNGDGKSDVFWYGPSSADDKIWLGASRDTQFDKTKSVTAVNGTYQPLTGDFNGDGYADVFWYGSGAAADSLWYGTKTPGVFDNKTINVAGVFKPIVGDFNGNGQDDILWYAPGTAEDKIWYGSGSKTTKFVTSYNTDQINGTYTLVAGNFDGDPYDDILLYGPGTAEDRLWYGTKTHGRFTSTVTSVNGTYTPVVGDYDKNGRSDVFWYAAGPTEDRIWYGTKSRETKFEMTISPNNVNGTYTPIPGDFDGNGYGDIFWYGPGTASDSLWYGTSTRGQYLISPTTVNGVYTPI